MSQRVIGEPTLILISGLPRSGKTSLADALGPEGFTHVPLDRYFYAMPAGVTFLEWVASPACIDWELVERHVVKLEGGESLVAPAGLDVSWGAGGIQQRQKASRREMRPSPAGYAVPGCYAFECPIHRRQLRVFVRTPRRVIAERALKRGVPADEVEAVLDEHLANWQAIERYEDFADLVVSGVDPHEAQLDAIRQALASQPLPGPPSR